MRALVVIASLLGAAFIASADESPVPVLVLFTGDLHDGDVIPRAKVVIVLFTEVPCPIDFYENGKKVLGLRQAWTIAHPLNCWAPTPSGGYSIRGDMRSPREYPHLDQLAHAHMGADGALRIKQPGFVNAHAQDKADFSVPRN